MIKSSQLRYSLRVLFFILFGLLSLKTLIYHFDLIKYPGIAELREPAMIFSTKLISEGSSLYSTENQPQGFNAYGPYYHEIVSWVLPFFSNTWVAHRAVAGVCLILSLLIFSTLWRQTMRIEGSLVLLLTLSLYHALMAHVTPLARPDTLGFLVFSLSIVIPAVFGFGWLPLLIAVLIGSTAMFIKIYFILAPFILISFVFLFVSRIKGIVTFIVMAAGLILQWYLISRNGPYLLNNIVNIYINTTTQYRAGMGYAFSQLFDFVKFNFGYATILVVSILFLKPWNNRKFSFKISSDWQPNALLIWAFFVSVFVFLYKLGPHGGTYMTYAFHLIQPLFLSVVAITIPALTRKNQFFYQLALVVGIFTAFYSFKFSMPEKSFKRDEQSHSLIRNYAKNGMSLGSPAVGEEFYELGIPLQDNGMIEFFEFSAPKGKLFKFGVAEENISQAWDKYLNGIRESINNKKYSALFIIKGTLLSRFESDYLKFYNRVDTVTISFPHTLQSWPVEVYLPK